MAYQITLHILPYVGYRMERLYAGLFEQLVGPTNFRHLLFQTGVEFRLANVLCSFLFFVWSVTKLLTAKKIA